MPAEQENGQEEAGISPEERERILASFEARIESGDFGGRAFHNVVRQELYPLLGQGELSEEEFSRLVRRWARTNSPHDWPTREYLREG